MFEYTDIKIVLASLLYMVLSVGMLVCVLFIRHDIKEVLNDE
jgi:hypothetical protein